ncbi:uncharacterized protein LOC113232638 [Hyposmocoma kahamanoa]|uniref:uncharacterized protein LOC113232638 n=1 Tax=Hyposmocoma kahamanoa TaxID=1477025 RepID=UPI000E6D6BA9|nr:uncharacterized protein LOC113232638 [Hyposmocoma kahamanoa]
MSPEYRLDGATVLQVKIESETTKTEPSAYTCIYFIKFKKAVQNDQQIYTLKVSSEKFKIKDSIFLTDDIAWRKIGEALNCERIDFDFTFEVDSLMTSITPFKHLYDDTELTDFKIVGESGCVEVHKTVLASFSPEFNQNLSFLDKLLNKKETKASKETLEHLKSYMYLQILPQDGIRQLAELAIHFDMTDLVTKCCIKLLNEVTPDNVLSLLEFATTNNLHKLTIGILKYVQSGYITVDDIKIPVAETYE